MNGSTHSYDIASMLVRKGHEVTMITSNKTGDRSSFENINGIKVYWLACSYNSKMVFLNKVISFIEFMFKSTILLLKIKCDLVFSTSTPLTIGIPSIIKKKIHQTPFIFEVRDLWPAVPIEMGIISNKFFIKILTYLEKTIYDYASKIFVISHGIAELINAPKQKVKVFPFGCNMEKYHKIKKSSFKNDNNFEDKIVVGLIGSIGFANDPIVIVETARLLKKMKNNTIQFVFIGEGSAKSEIVRLIRNEYLDNIALFNSVNKNEALSIIKSIDAGLILHGSSKTYRYTASPNKFFDYLASGLNIIYNFDGPLKDLLIKEKVGYFFNYDDYENLAKYLNQLTKSKLKRMARHNYKLARNTFNMDEILEKMYNEIIVYYPS